MNTLDIRQLLDRYFQGDTNLEEEALLRGYFTGNSIDPQLMAYKPWFDYCLEEQQTTLGSDFDQRMLQLAGQQPSTKARTISLHSRLMPLFKAAAVVIFVLLLGNSLQTVVAPKDTPTASATTETTTTGINVARNDSAVIDSMKQSKAALPVEQEMSIPIE